MTEIRSTTPTAAAFPGREHGTAGADTAVDVAVLGSGLAGLAAAATAARAGARVTVVEGPARSGRARTDERDGFLLNRGPHALYDTGPGRAVLARLGVDPQGVRPPSTGVLACGDQVHRLPRGIGGMLTSSVVTARDKVRIGHLLARVARLDPASVADLTVEGWLERSLPPSARPLVRTLVRVSSYCADTRSVSADVAVTQLRASSRGVRYLHGGWAQLTDGLRAAAGPTVEWHPGTATAVRPTGGGWDVTTDRGTVRAGAVVVAAGSPAAAAALLPGPAPASWSRLGPPVLASCLDLGLRRPPAVRSWFGVDRPHYLVAHAPGAELAPPGSAVVHVMRNLHHDDADRPAQLRAELEALARRAGIADDDVVVARYLHHMHVVSASVTPAGGGLTGRPGIDDTGHTGLLVAGDWVGPDGWLADASLASGEAAGAAASRHAAVAAQAGPGRRPAGARR